MRLIYIFAGSEPEQPESSGTQGPGERMEQGRR